jgi:DNA-binding NarL/FixJ family response regulator
MYSEPAYPERTPEETWVLGLMAEGASTQAIALELGISERTVASVVWKVSNRPDAGHRRFDTDE